ncbi:MAG: hypothetical protein Q4P66_08040 [Actinomycetaceae bacterium]|nr:hypothetical protein [Actinomycetaceae bacterium]
MAIVHSAAKVSPTTGDKATAYAGNSTRVCATEGARGAYPHSYGCEVNSRETAPVAQPVTDTAHPVSKRVSSIPLSPTTNCKNVEPTAEKSHND